MYIIILVPKNISLRILLSDKTIKYDMEGFLRHHCKEIEENNRMRKTRDLFKKIRYQRNISCKNGHNK